MDELKKEILKLTAKYIKRHYHNKPYTQGDRVNYAGRVFDEHEVVNLVDSALDFWLTSGHYTDEFEKKLADFIGVKYCALVNSGSSANLLAFMALTSPLLEERAIKYGDEIITVAAGFPTTIAPIVQFGAVPVFVDITIPEYNIDVLELASALSNKTKAVFLAHTLGNPFDIAAIKAFCDKYNLWLIEDNCDALGSKYIFNNTIGMTGSFGDIATSSFYPPHHITTGEGGAVYTDNPLLSKIVRSMRDWGRDCVCASGQDNLCTQRFDGQFGSLPKGYDHKYVYSHFGYNLKATDMQASIGVAQLDKIDDFVEKRIHNYERLYSALQLVSDYFILPKACKNSLPSWFGFPILCCQDSNRNNIVRYLESKNIQTRMLFAGNITRQPCIKYAKYRCIGKLPNTDRVMNDLFWVGVYPNMTDEMIDYMAKTLIEFKKQWG